MPLTQQGPLTLPALPLYSMVSGVSRRAAAAKSTYSNTKEACLQVQNPGAPPPPKNVPKQAAKAYCFAACKSFRAAASSFPFPPASTLAWPASFCTMPHSQPVGSTTTLPRTRPGCTGSHRRLPGPSDDIFVTTSAHCFHVKRTTNTLGGLGASGAGTPGTANPTSPPR